MRKALEGIKVIQLANFIAAAATGRYLADHGADVIMVESPKGDPIRYTQQQEGRPQNIKENVAWEYLNGNKRCISLNTKTEEGKKALFDLLEDADVLLTNWRLGALQSAGLDAALSSQALKIDQPRSPRHGMFPLRAFAECLTPRVLRRGVCFLFNNIVECPVSSFQ